MRPKTHGTPVSENFRRSVLDRVKLSQVAQFDAATKVWRDSSGMAIED